MTITRIPKAVKVIIIGVIFAFAFAINLNRTSAPANHDGGSVFVAQAYAAPESVVINENATDESGAATDSPAISEVPGGGVKITEVKKAFDPQIIMDKVAEYSIYIHGFFYPFINFFAFHTGNFLGTDYIYAGAMGEMLNKIWTVSRNLVNIIFVLILLFLALKEIFFIKEEGAGGIKKSLITLALLLVAVNFSWLGTKVILDTANIATNIVFALPSGVANTGIEKIIKQDCKMEDVTVTGKDEAGQATSKTVKKTSGSCMPSGIYLPLSAEKYDFQYFSEEECSKYNNGKGIATAYQGGADSAFTAQGEVNKTLKDTDPHKKLQNMTTYCWGNTSFFNYNKNTSTVYLIYGMARIQNIINSSNDPGAGPIKLLMGTLFSLLIQVAYLLTLGALFIALIFRMAVLWLFVAFSPFLVLLMYFGGQAKGLGDLTSKFSVSEFARWAFVPTMVGAVFSVAFIMLAAGQSITDVTLFENIGAAAGVKIFGFKSLFMGMDNIQEFIWLVIVLVTLWLGVFGVLGKMQGLGKITDKIKSWGTETGSLIAKSPYYLPITPMVNPKTGERMSMAEILKPITGMNEKLRGYQRDHGGSEVATADDKARHMTPTQKKEIIDLMKDHAPGFADKIAINYYGFSSAKAMFANGDDPVKALFETTGGEVKDNSTELLTIIKDDMRKTTTAKPAAPVVTAEEEAVKAKAKAPPKPQ